MKDKKEYKMPELSETPSLCEPHIGYNASLPFMSREEALEHGMPLAESRRIVFERIRQDFKR